MRVITTSSSSCCLKMSRIVFFVLFSLAVDFSLSARLPHELPSEANYRWELIPDTDGNMHLVDLNTYVAAPEPLFVAEKDMKFFLFTRSVRGGEQITMNEASLEASSFDRTHPTRLTIHGWNGDETSLVNAAVIQEYLNLGNFNCIMVDWSRGAGTLDYITARNRLYDVATYTSHLVEFLFHKHYLSFEKLHIVGHSLGAHAAGLIGKYVVSGRIQAIFGLDPAGPLFWIDSPDERLHVTDASYVEILHTNGFNLGYGSPGLGHAEFYPNFGRWQPGCGIEFTGSCSHGRAPELFAESINGPGFAATRCATPQEIEKDKCTDQSPGIRYMMTPETADFALNGHFYFSTNKQSPFAKLD